MAIRRRGVEVFAPRWKSLWGKGLRMIETNDAETGAAIHLHLNDVMDDYEVLLGFRTMVVAKRLLDEADKTVHIATNAAGRALGKADTAFPSPSAFSYLRDARLILREGAIRLLVPLAVESAKRHHSAQGKESEYEGARDSARRMYDAKYDRRHASETLAHAYPAMSDKTRGNIIREFWGRVKEK